MGFAISWIACRETHTNAVLQRLHFTPTGETEDVPDSPLSLFRAAGWCVVWANEYGSPHFTEKKLAELSTVSDIVLALVEEHAMASSAEYWTNGTRQWRISHQGENGPIGLDVEGQPPAIFVDIRSSLEKEQEEAGGMEADVDYLFDIPLKVAESITGFKHDVVLEGKFEVLQHQKPKNAGFFQRLFGS